MRTDVTSQPARILVVDDEPRSLELLVRTLRRLGRVDTATTGEAAWESAQSAPIDLVITDQRMPGMKGVELLTKVAALDAHAGRVLLTGYADINATIEAINAGRVHAYVSKPWQPDQMLLTAQSLLERVRLARQNEQLLAALGSTDAAAAHPGLGAEQLAAIDAFVAMVGQEIRLDAARMRRALASLAGDAARALPEGGSIVVETTRDDGEARLLVMSAASATKPESESGGFELRLPRVATPPTSA